MHSTFGGAARNCTAQICADAPDIVVATACSAGLSLALAKLRHANDADSPRRSSAFRQAANVVPPYLLTEYGHQETTWRGCPSNLEPLRRANLAFVSWQVIV